jgi:YbgC/YbaW family acyl-CoA thioester hydrolase
MKYTAEITVRSYECDSYSHVNNAVYLNYLEYGRMEFLHHIHFDYNGLIAAGYYLYVTHIDIHYKSSAYLDDVLDMTIYPTKQGAVSGSFRQVLAKKDGTVCAEADVTWASVKQGGQLAKIPDAFMVPELCPDPSDFTV